MSEFKVRCVKIQNVEKHPNADRLSIAMVDGGYPVLFNTSDWKEGDLVAYVPVDSLVPQTKEWAFLAAPFVQKDEQGKPIGPPPEVPGKYNRIRARKLRGVFSMGLFHPLPPGNWKEGDDLGTVMGIVQYDKEIDIPEEKPYKPQGNFLVRFIKKLWYRFRYPPVKPVVPPFTFPEYTDIEALRKHTHALQEGEEVVITEKVHGANFRVAFSHGKLWVGSHHGFRGRPKGKTLTASANWWWKAVFNTDLETKLAKAPDLAFYGEVYGVVQRGYGYDCPQDVRVRFFDILDLKTLKYLDYDDFLAQCEKVGVEVVPELYRGPWKKELKDLSNGKSVLNPKHIREGFVVKSAVERCGHWGRTIFKLIGEEYLLKKE